MAVGGPLALRSRPTRGSFEILIYLFVSVPLSVHDIPVVSPALPACIAIQPGWRETVSHGYPTIFDMIEVVWFPGFQADDFFRTT